MNIEKLERELKKTYDKIEELQLKAEGLEEQKRQALDIEYLKIIHKSKIGTEDLQLLIAAQIKANKEILARKEGQSIEENL